MKRIFIFLWLVAAPVEAQLLHFGFKGGFPLNDAIQAQGNFRAASRRWTLGPSAELGLPFGFAVEAGLLYRKLAYSDAAENTAHSWSVPLLAKYHFPGAIVRPYILGGVTFRSLGDLPRLEGSPESGFVLGAGIRYDVKFFKFSPELRWSRYGEGRAAVPVPARDLLGTKQNQAELLFGITF